MPARKASSKSDSAASDALLAQPALSDSVVPTPKQQLDQTIQLARQHPVLLHPHDIRRLQQTVGNQAVQRLLARNSRAAASSTTSTTTGLVQRGITLRRYDKIIDTPTAGDVLQFLGAYDKAYGTQFVAEVQMSRRLRIALDICLSEGQNKKYGYLQVEELMRDIRNAVPRVLPTLIQQGNMEALAHLAERSGAATYADVLAVLNSFNHPGRIARFIIGNTVHLRKVAAGHTDKICHHYAFGGLQGNDAAFNMANLVQTLAVPNMSYQKYLETTTDPEPLDEDIYQLLPSPDMTTLAGSLIDISQQVQGVAADGNFPVRVYDNIAHSARLVGGKWWHKFSGLASLISIDGEENLGYNVTAQLTVRSAQVGGADGSFIIQ